MATNILSDALERLFVNRDECYCVQTKNGYAKIEEPLTDDVLQKHLEGILTVGSYQLNRENHVKWLCLDFDPEKLGQETQQATLKVLEVLFEEKEVEPGKKQPRIWKKAVLLEASRYPDPSYHIWILFLIPVLAKVAQWLGYRIVELAGLNPKLVEVFPKQTELAAERPFGNFVKIPLGMHQVAQKWSRFLDFQTFEPLPSTYLLDAQGIIFSEHDSDRILSFKPKANVQIKFNLPTNFKILNNKEEEKAVRFLCKYWREGHRNDLEMCFLGLCLKKGVAVESARRIIEEVVLRTGDNERASRLGLVDYHYQNRLATCLKGLSGIREIVKEMKNHGPK
jgi:hypothetical protein